MFDNFGVYGWSLYNAGKFKEAEEKLDEVEKMLQDILDIRKRICSDIKGASWLAQIYQDIACLEEIQKSYTDALKKIDSAECLYDK